MDACNREKRIAQLRREGAGELVRKMLISKNGRRVHYSLHCFETQAHYGGRMSGHY